MSAARTIAHVLRALSNDAYEVLHTDGTANGQAVSLTIRTNVPLGDDTDFDVFLFDDGSWTVSLA